jgi:hypothetical protein
MCLLVCMVCMICVVMLATVLLHTVLPFELFWAILATNAVVNVAAFNISMKLTEPSRLGGPYRRVAAELSNLMAAFLTSLLTCEALVAVERPAIESRAVVIAEPRSQLPLFDQRFWQAIIAVFGISAAGAGWCFLFHHVGLLLRMHIKDFKRLQRKIHAKTCLAPRPKDVILEGDARLAIWLGVDCAICLGSLVNTHTNATNADPSDSLGTLTDEALLRLPCEHIFHDACASQWVLQEDACPLCRRVVGNLRKCERLHFSEPNVGLKGCEWFWNGWCRQESRPACNAA